MNEPRDIDLATIWFMAMHPTFRPGQLGEHLVSGGFTIRPHGKMLRTVYSTLGRQALEQAQAVLAESGRGLDDLIRRLKADVSLPARQRLIASGYQWRHYAGQEGAYLRRDLTADAAKLPIYEGGPADKVVLEMAPSGFIQLFSPAIDLVISYPVDTKDGEELVQIAVDAASRADGIGPVYAWA